MKILVIDRPFPAIHAQWRIEEVKSFIVEKNADVLSIASKECYYKEMEKYYGIKDYNILIFKTGFNYLNVFNKRINGIAFNNKHYGDFLLTKYGNFDLSRYDAIFSIFYSRWKLFNEYYPGFPNHKQFVHLYPGGHMKDLTNIGIPIDVNLITTQKYITEFVRQQGYSSYTEIIGASMLQRNHKITPKKINKGRLKVCYSAFGKPKVKGGDIYIQAAELYKITYPNDNIDFISIGRCDQGNYIQKYDYMTMEELKGVYDTVDIYVSPERGRLSNGWPLGIEAGLRGSVLITTDPFNSASVHPFGNDVLIVEIDNPQEIVNHIKHLYDDRKLLNDISIRIQKGLSEFYSFENQQQRMFDFIQSKI